MVAHTVFNVLTRIHFISLTHRVDHGRLGDNALSTIANKLSDKPESPLSIWQNLASISPSSLWGA